MGLQKILIIEDDPDFAASLELILGLHDRQAVLAGSAEEALAVIAESPQDYKLAFLDIKLPRMDGIACVDRITSRWPQISCIIMTGFRDNERMEKARSAGAAEILFKPFRMEQFLETVDKYI